jgi:large subunit ribosomal protein L25
MSDATLTAEPREQLGTRPAGRLRRGGRVPAIVYGHGGATEHVTVAARDLNHILASGSGANTLITLSMGRRSETALARQIQRHPVRGDIVHVDFVRVSADEQIAAEVPVHLVGEAEGVRNGGVLDQVLFTISVQARPGDLPPAIEHDISPLDIGAQIRAGELTMPPGVELAAEPDALVASIAAPTVAVAEEELEAEAVEGEAPPEGAAAEAAAAAPEAGAEGESE